MHSQWMASITPIVIGCIDYLAYRTIFTCVMFCSKIKLDVFFPAGKAADERWEVVHRPQRRWLLSLHNNQHDTPSFLKSFLNFFVAMREKKGVAQTMSPGERETITVRPHYQALMPRLWRTDPRWSGSANNARSHCRSNLNELPTWKVWLGAFENFVSVFVDEASKTSVIFSSVNIGSIKKGQVTFFLGPTRSVQKCNKNNNLTSERNQLVTLLRIT